MYTKAMSMERIFITGTAGAGKSVLAKNLSERLGIARHCLDDMAWRPNWVRTPSEEFTANLRDITARDSWIIEGADTRRKARDIVLPRADTYVWVDPSPAVIAAQLTLRTVRNLVEGKPICNGNYEKLSDVFSKGSVYIWSARSWLDNRRTLGPDFRGAAARPGLSLVHIKSREDARRFLDALPANSAR